MCRHVRENAEEFFNNFSQGKCSMLWRQLLKFFSMVLSLKIAERQRERERDLSIESRKLLKLLGTVKIWCAYMIWNRCSFFVCLSHCLTWNLVLSHSIGLIIKYMIRQSMRWANNVFPSFIHETSEQERFSKRQCIIAVYCSLKGLKPAFVVSSLLCPDSSNVLEWKIHKLWCKHMWEGKGSGTSKATSLFHMIHQHWQQLYHKKSFLHWAAWNNGKCFITFCIEINVH